MKSIKSQLLFAAFVLAMGATISRATEYTFNGVDTTVTLNDPSGSALDHDINLQLGAFAPGFTPTADNTADWASHWLTSPSSIGVVADNGTTWTTSMPLADQSVIASGEQLYLWAYDQRDLSSGSAEWLLVTAADFRAGASFQADTNNHDFYFTLYTVGSDVFDYSGSLETVVGSLDVGTGTAELASVAGSSVPEPSTYAAIFGAGALGWVFWRRRQALKAA